MMPLLSSVVLVELKAYHDSVLSGDPTVYFSDIPLPIYIYLLSGFPTLIPPPPLPPSPPSPPSPLPPSPSPPPTQANCIDSTAEPTKVFAGEIKKLQADQLKPQEQLTLEPYERDHAVVVGMYR